MTSKTDYKKFAFREPDEFSEMKSWGGGFKSDASTLPRDKGNLPNSTTSGLSKRAGQNAFNNTPRGETPRD